MTVADASVGNNHNYSNSTKGVDSRRPVLASFVTGSMKEFLFNVRINYVTANLPIQNSFDLILLFNVLFTYRVHNFEYFSDNDSCCVLQILVGGDSFQCWFIQRH